MAVDQKLTDRTELTTSSDSALLHVADGGISKKQTKANLLNFLLTAMI